MHEFPRSSSEAVGENKPEQVERRDAVRQAVELNQFLLHGGAGSISARVRRYMEKHQGQMPEELSSLLLSTFMLVTQASDGFEKVLPKATGLSAEEYSEIKDEVDRKEKARLEHNAAIDKRLAENPLLKGMRIDKWD